MTSFGTTDVERAGHVLATYHYASLLRCGHFKQLRSNWNGVIEAGASWTPTEAYCTHCRRLVEIVGFGRVNGYRPPASEDS